MNKKPESGYPPHPANLRKLTAAAFDAIAVLADAAATLSGENVEEPLRMAERCATAIRRLAESLGQ